MDNVADLCGGLCKVAGDKIGADAADALFRAFSRFAQPGRPASDRAMAMGCFAELCVELPPPLAAERHFATLQPLFSAACRDPSPAVTRNAAFGLGALCKAAPVPARAVVAEALQALYPLVGSRAAKRFLAEPSTRRAGPRPLREAPAASPRPVPRTIYEAPAASPRPVPRTIHEAPAASPRPVPRTNPRGTRGVAATQPRTIRRRRRSLRRTPRPRSGARRTEQPRTTR